MTHISVNILIFVLYKLSTLTYIYKLFIFIRQHLVFIAFLFHKTFRS